MASDWQDFCESEGLGNGESAFNNFEKWLNNMSELFNEDWDTYDPDNPCIDQDDDTFVPCDGCPGFGNHHCCATEGDYNNDYLSDLLREEDAE